MDFGAQIQDILTTVRPMVLNPWVLAPSLATALAVVSGLAGRVIVILQDAFHQPVLRPHPEAAGEPSHP
jgi:hypothetical protein